MTDGLLENIILLEKQIQAEVATERSRAEKWQELELTALHGFLTTAQAAEDARCRQLLAAEKQEMSRQGDATEAASVDWCQRLSSLDDTLLKRILQKHLAVILPGGDHDHPHGQS